MADNFFSSIPVDGGTGVADTPPKDNFFSSIPTNSPASAASSLIPPIPSRLTADNGDDTIFSGGGIDTNQDRQLRQYTKPSDALTSEFSGKAFPKSPAGQSQLSRLTGTVDATPLPVSGTTGQVATALSSPPKTFTDLIDVGNQIQQNNRDTDLHLRSLAKKHGIDPNSVAKLPNLFEQYLQGGANAALDTGVSLTSPLALLTGGFGALPKAAQKAASLGFSAQMLSQFPDQAKALLDEENKTGDDRDESKVAQNYLGALTSLGFGVAAGAHGTAPDFQRETAPHSNVSFEKPTAINPLKNDIQPPQPPAEAAKPVAQPPQAQATDQNVSQPAGQGTPPSSPPEATAENQPVLQPALPKPEQLTKPENAFVSKGVTRPSISADYFHDAGDATKNPDWWVNLFRMSNEQNHYTQETAYQIGLYLRQLGDEKSAPVVDALNSARQKMGDIGKSVRDAFRNAPDDATRNKISSSPDFMLGAVTQFPREAIESAFNDGSAEGTIPESVAKPLSREKPTVKESLTVQSPTATAGVVTPKNAPEPGLAAPVQSGGDRSVTGLAARVREQRETAGQTDPTQPGKGIAPEASVERGRQLVQSGADPESVMQQFEKTNRVSSDDFAVARAHTENLARATNEAEDKFGRDSTQFKDAYKTESDWASRTKAMQTEWAKSGHAQQGEVDIDTGSFSGLKRAYRDSHDGEELPAKDEKKAQALADENKKLAAEKADLMKRLSAAIDNETEPKIEPHVRIIADKLKGFFETSAKSALDRIKARRAEGRLFAGIDPTELADYATYGASKILSKGIEGAEMTADWAKEMTQEIGDYVTPHLKQIWDASKKALDLQLRKVAGVGATAKKVKDAVAATVEKPAISAADQKALDAANKTVREAAARLAKAETDASVLQSGKNKTASKQQVDNARKAVEAANKTVREAAARAAELENKKRIAEAAKKQVPGTVEHTRTEFFRYKGGVMDSDQVRALWNYAKKNYIDKGNDDFTDIVNKVSTDLGLKFKDVADGLSQSKATRKITDELWRKQTDARRVSENAKRWVRSQNTPILGQTVPRIARLMFGLKVAGHGGVAFGTHAPMVAFMPKYTKTYLRDFGKMYKMVFSTAEYEKNVQALRADPNFTTAQRAGLVNDPYKVEDFNNPDMAQILGNTGKLLGKIAGGGNRGYFALKVLRQDMFNQGWNKLPESIKSPEMAKAMADDINHITGVVKGSGGNKASLALFAPRLLMSRAAFLVGDPYKAVEIASTAMSPAKWKALPPEQKFQVINQVKQKATILAVAYGLLKANQAVLSATGSNQKINTTDPTKSDFMKFKIAGMDFSYGNAMLNMARLPVRLWTIGAGDGGKLKKVIYPDESMYSAAGEFARSQASPLASLGLDLLFKGDYQNRPLPQIPGYGKPIPLPKRLAAQGIKPYTWTEFFAEQVSPIPFEEAEREIWRTGFGLSHEQMKSLAKAAGTTLVMMGTGGRLTEDIQPKSTQPTSRFKQ